MEEAVGSPEKLALLRDDPSAIVPERALVFEVASDVADFYRAARGVPGLDFLGEDEGTAAPDMDFYVPDSDGIPRTDRDVPRRFYFTVPDRRALVELVSLWKRHQRGDDLGYGRKAWKQVFDHLADLRAWGPKDRLTQDAIDDWSLRLETHPDRPVRFEAEFWYREDSVTRATAAKAFSDLILQRRGKVLDHALIDPIRYQATLAEVHPKVIKEVLDNRDLELVGFNEVMVLRPQADVSAPRDAELPSTIDAAWGSESEIDLEPPLAALLDGVPMAQHTVLANRLIVDDPDEFSDMYGSAAEQSHGTAMASLVLNGDLNVPNEPLSVRQRLYVRPVMYPHAVGPDDRLESMPEDQLGVDLIWRAFIRMFEGEEGQPPIAPTVRVVNLSLGDANRRFTSVMSPWAKLIDYLSWKYGVLVVVSAGNIYDRIPLAVSSWADLEAMPEDEREATFLQAIVGQRANRRLLSPSEAVNALTIGAAHTDSIAPNGHAVMAVDPYSVPSLPNASSALGLGLRRTIKPEVLFPGGCEQVRSKSNVKPIEVVPVRQGARYFGIGAAAPGTSGETNRTVNLSGTSVATALATHSSVRILNSLSNLPVGPEYPAVDTRFHSVLLKCLLVHSARWEEDAVAAIRTVLRDDGRLYWEHERDEISRFLGFGSPDVDRVVECSERRATLIGWNAIRSRETDQFRVPLPDDLEDVEGYRALTVTVAWLTPVDPSHRTYRLARFKVEPGGDRRFSLAVDNAKEQPSHNVLGRGTVYHQRWEGNDAATFMDDGYLVLNVTCAPLTADLDSEIPYGLAVSLEVGTNVSVPVYSQVRERLRQAVQVKP